MLLTALLLGQRERAGTYSGTISPEASGTADEARIVAVDYAGHRITLARPLSWDAGQGVGLAYFGQGPDQGAFEHAPER